MSFYAPHAFSRFPSPPQPLTLGRSIVLSVPVILSGVVRGRSPPSEERRLPVLRWSCPAGGLVLRRGEAVSRCLWVETVSERGSGFFTRSRLHPGRRYIVLSLFFSGEPQREFSVREVGPSLPALQSSQPLRSLSVARGSPSVGVKVIFYERDEKHPHQTAFAGEPMLAGPRSFRRIWEIGWSGGALVGATRNLDRIFRAEIGLGILVGDGPEPKLVRVFGHLEGEGTGKDVALLATVSYDDRPGLCLPAGKMPCSKPVTVFDALREENRVPGTVSSTQATKDICRLTGTAGSPSILSILVSSLGKSDFGPWDSCKFSVSLKVGQSRTRFGGIWSIFSKIGAGFLISLCQLFNFLQFLSPRMWIFDCIGSYIVFYRSNITGNYGTDFTIADSSGGSYPQYE